MRARGLLGLALALLVIAGGGAVSRAEQRSAPRVVEVVCSHEGTRVVRGVGDARPQGVTVRFRHPAGHWNFFFEGAPGNWSSSGSAMIAELRLPMPPGPVRLRCMPSVGSTIHSSDPRGWVDVRAEDPRGLWRDPQPDCTELVSAVDFQVRRPRSEEREAAREALEHAIRVRDGDELARVAYPRQQPRMWGLYRDGALIAIARLMPPDPDGMVAADYATGCTSAGHA